MPPRRSLFMPLLLVLVGTLLLVRNFHPEFPFWEVVGRYWPVVLVIWGLAKLVESLRRPDGPTPWRPSLTVGEFFLALFIVLVGISASKWVEVRRDIPWGQIDIDWPWAERYSFAQDLKQGEVPANSSLYVENFAGDVRVTGADTTEIAVTVNKQVRAGSEQEAKKIADSLNAEIVRDGNTYTVRVPGQGQMRADLQLTVPKKMPVRFEIRRGSIDVNSTVGDVNGEIDRGDASVSNIEGNVRVQLRHGSFSAQNVNGNVELEGRGSDIQVADVTGQLLIRGDYSGASDYSRIAQGVKFTSSRTDMEIQKLPGRVEMTLGSLAITDPAGAVAVNTRNKDIRVEGFDEKVTVVNRGASVELRTHKLPLRDIEVENHSGPIELELPAKSEFQVEATARRGEVESDFPALQMNTGDENGQIHGRVGAAGSTVKLTTSYGSIRIRKAGTEVEKAGPDEQPATPPNPKPPKRPVIAPAQPPARAWNSDDAFERQVERAARQTELLANRHQRRVEELARRKQADLEKALSAQDRALQRLEHRERVQ